MTIFLDTPRLILKAPELSDFDNLLALRTDPDVMKYIGDGSIQTKAQVQEFLTKAMSYQKKYGFGFCSVFEKDSGEFVGQAGILHLAFDDSQPDIEVGYRLHKKFWGKGYATELTKALIYWAFENLAIDKLVAVTHPDHQKSQHVLLKSGLDKVEKAQFYHGREVVGFEIYKADCIDLVPYNEQWPILAKEEMNILREQLPQHSIIDIQHVGSTAIPGMISKPTIDIQIAVDNLKKIKPDFIAILTKLGYQFWAENPDPERLFFVKGLPPFGEKRTHHVHVVEPSSKHWKEKLLFRDYLISHPEVAQEYVKLKQTLAKNHKYDREAYTNEKAAFIMKIIHY